MRIPLLYLFILSLFSQSVTAQFFPPHHYPQNYFQWPTNAKVGIVANFGELRPNHYHMGLDVRTDSKENMNVLAAAEGYISKVHIDANGFGRALYISHPNGYTTLYAHLNDFNPELERYVNEQQYLLKKWNVDLDLPKGMFTVKKGQFIAYSGNTGGSQGPHIHFEIRETNTDKVLNPLLFGMPIPDNQAPNIFKLAVYNRDISTLEQQPKIYPLKKINGIYKLPAEGLTIDAKQISFAVNAFDSYTGSTNQNGIFSSIMLVDDEPIAGFELDRISYDETRTLNGHIDYKMKANGGSFMQHVSPLPGCMEVIYKTKPGTNGFVDLTDRQPHNITIKVIDVAGNTSSIVFSVKSGDGAQQKTVTQKENYFEPGLLNVYNDDQAMVYLPERCLFEAFHFKTQKIENALLLGGEDIPINDYFNVGIKQEVALSDTGNIIMKITTRGKARYKKATYTKGWCRSSSFRDLGKAEIIIDHAPPSINPLFGFRDEVQWKNNRIAFSVSDNTKEIASFNAYLDGQWLLFSNDKSSSFIYKIDKYCTPGEHNLRIVVSDLTGNTTEKNYHFYR